MKEGILGNRVPNLLKEVAGSSGWALCVGAGISVPIFPSWPQLVENLISRRNGKTRSASLTKELLDYFETDALIQAANNLFGLSNDDFSKLLSEELYSNLKSCLSASEWTLYCKISLSPNPGSLSNADWEKALDMFERHFSACSGYALAEELATIIDTELAPSEIISFNAESSFLAMLTASIWKRFQEQGKLHVKKYVDIVTRSISARYKHRVLYVYCHGYLPPAFVHRGKDIFPSEKLVFSENEYLQLANNAFSWQSSTFLNICSNRRVLFVGVSLSDSNMRRWLSWLQNNRSEEIRLVYGRNDDSTYHYWIKKLPKSNAAKEWIEACVAHLGVRIVWINDWSEVRPTFRRLLNM